MKKFVLSLVAMFAISGSLVAQNGKGHTTYLEAYRQRVENALNPVSAERVMYHVLLDGSMDYEDKGWSFKFTKTHFSSTGFDDGGITDYTVVAISNDGALRSEYDVREVQGSNYETHVYEHTISVRMYAGGPPLNK